VLWTSRLASTRDQTRAVRSGLPLIAACDAEAFVVADWMVQQYDLKAVYAKWRSGDWSGWNHPVNLGPNVFKAMRGACRDGRLNTLRWVISTFDSEDLREGALTYVCGSYGDMALTQWLAPKCARSSVKRAIRGRFALEGTRTAAIRWLEGVYQMPPQEWISES